MLAAFQNIWFQIKNEKTKNMKQYAITAVVVIVAMAVFFSVFKLTNADKSQAFGLSLTK